MDEAGGRIPDAALDDYVLDLRDQGMTRDDVYDFLDGEGVPAAKIDQVLDEYFEDELPAGSPEVEWHNDEHPMGSLGGEPHDVDKVDSEGENWVTDDEGTHYR